MKVKKFLVNPLMTNCYVVYDHKEAVIVDPGQPSQEVLDFVQEKGLETTAIINTHGHADHIAGNAWFVEQTGAPLWIHEAEVAFLFDPKLHLGHMIRQEFSEVQPQRLLKDGDLISVGKGSLKVLHTPGHTPGGISLYSPGFVLSGDTMFKSSVGRWDLPLGDLDVLRRSLQMLAQLPPETVVYPGHGESTTISDEIENNPFLK